VLRLTTDSLGFVTLAVVTRSSGRALNDSIAVLNARESRFQPIRREGRPVGSAFKRQYRFRATREDEQPDLPKGKSEKNGH
jgi:outer membrane biosynthesis protein TonB